MNTGQHLHQGMGHSKQQAGSAPAPRAAADNLGDRCGLQDPRMQAALLHHPALSQDQQVVLALLQASKQLRVAVAERCAGQAPAVLQAQSLCQVLCFAQRWLPKHGGVLKQLEVQLVDSGTWVWEHSKEQSEAAVQALAAALEQQQHLQAFSLCGAPAGPILQHLPAAQLTRLCSRLGWMISSDSIAALSRLTGLRSLELHGGYARNIDGPSALAPIAALQQLTELCIGTVTLKQLQLLRLPTLLQRLDVAVDLCQQPKWLEQLADWLEQHGKVVRRLALTKGQFGPAAAHRFAAALQAVGSAPHAALPAGAAQASVTAAASAASSPLVELAGECGLQLQSFSTDSEEGPSCSTCQPAG